MDKAAELLERGVANIIPDKNVLLGKLRGEKKLNIYLGIDPTSTKIHLGHAVALRKLQQFAKLGHNVTFLIGDFTALIGDTSDKESERPALTRGEISENFKTYKKQAQKVLDFSKVKIKYNGEWLKKLIFEDILKLMQHFSAGDFVGRELIKKRLSANKRVGLHELLYPVMQGYDSFMLDTDIQIGGTDQTFNMQAGRTLLKNLKNKESFVLTTPILEGADGRKMSKSFGNAIWLDDSPTDMFAKIMSINDDLIIQYFTLSTNTPLSDIKNIEKRLEKENPINIKKQLAFEIVRGLDGEKAATLAQQDFERLVQKKEMPLQLNTFTPTSGASIARTISEWANISASEVKRVINQGGIELDGQRIDLSEAKKPIKIGSIVRVGKKPPFRIEK
ncbi:MAG: tyrosine--tRNA ligase [Candidatus Levybacteria bacterium RIFCSPHIGHO2_01_FULL_37_17]|nr:MAG: tyrosine--tRNA ligase [Candidatus Levybacteria bacterium RIFCSPHIGHO2_01_FULL_37_17]OGH36777.1 MAG: tyrosine--tRNA ligase [Candidatus Levybacteria bacterium RIFCSPLOWO2_01_FULL_38_23]